LPQLGRRRVRPPERAEDRVRVGVLELPQVHDHEPVRDEHVARGGRARVADVIAVMLNAPEFLYFVEHGTTAASGAAAGIYELTAYELASRLSYHFWQTMPDDELWTAAADGSLLTPAVFEHQVDRLVGDARTRPAIDEFVADWLKVEDLPQLENANADPVFRTFAGTDAPAPELRQQMIDDVVGMAGYFIWTRPGTVTNLFTSEQSFARGAALARIYGVPAWSGTGDPVALPPGERPGIFTRAAFLASGSANTRPIMRGVFLREVILCDAIPPPPPGANARPPELRPDMTTRQVVEEMTEQPNTACIGCHGPRINPLGFALEGFDGLGRHRTAQRLFDAMGAEVGSRPVNTATVPRVREDNTTASTGPGDLAQQVAASGKVEACVARNYFRFTFGRWEDLQADGCTLEAMRTRLTGNGTIRDMLREVALTPAFRRRAFE
jgi:hypothetical protein